MPEMSRRNGGRGEERQKRREEKRVKIKR